MAQEDVWPSPELDDLMNDVVSKIPAQWRAVGIQLGLPSCTLDSIQRQNAGKPQACDESFETVLSTWKHNQNKPYTWTTIIDALETPSVGQVALAAELRAKYMERKNRSVGTDAYAMRSRVQEPSPIHQRNGSNHNKTLPIVLSEENHDQLLKCTAKAAGDWRAIGRYLGFKQPQLNTIVQTAGHCPMDLYSDMLEKWLNLANPTLSDFVSALRSVGKERLALDVENMKWDEVRVQPNGSSPRLMVSEAVELPLQQPTGQFFEEQARAKQRNKKQPPLAHPSEGQPHATGNGGHNINKLQEEHDEHEEHEEVASDGEQAAADGGHEEEMSKESRRTKPAKPKAKDKRKSDSGPQGHSKPFPISEGTMELIAALLLCICIMLVTYIVVLHG